jgi:hypothetical protein
MLTCTYARLSNPNNALSVWFASDTGILVLFAATLLGLAWLSYYLTKRWRECHEFIELAVQYPPVGNKEEQAKDKDDDHDLPWAA